MIVLCWMAPHHRRSRLLALQLAPGSLDDTITGNLISPQSQHDLRANTCTMHALCGYTEQASNINGPAAMHAGIISPSANRPDVPTISATEPACVHHTDKKISYTLRTSQRVHTTGPNKLEMCATYFGKPNNLSATDSTNCTTKPRTRFNKSTSQP